ncbi:RNA polymerase sigma-70 factor [Dyadobacter sp. CY323]|uniref:RNA polymerase sigma-70 factor n=1 Tax=Dyadobacter sp. CY323 TaxID=2907302 RepID=UPI001F31E852|nr:RNA polymerase sigma-70 factor [Dyadobacter sp. CY323]MCE6990200.1 RNA polymerase sigma-70 factor [Dyadobacter sp. CY323]
MEKEEQFMDPAGKQRRLLPGPIHEKDAVKVIDSEMLLKRAFEKDSSAGAEALYKWYYAPLCSHAVRYVSSKEIAEDIVADVFFKFFAQRLYLKIDSSFRAYLFTCVRNSAFNYVQTEMRRSTSLEFAELVPIREDQQPDGLTQYEETYQDVEKAVNALPLKRRKIYIMHRVEGKKYQEIANDLEISIKTVKEQMTKAIQQIRKELKGKWFLLLIGFCQ